MASAGFFVALIGSALLTAFVVQGAIAYARRRALFDEPGRRRSHTLPTARGGGIGIVVGTLVFGALPIVATLGGAEYRFVPLLPLVAVAAIGWIDDHRPLGAAPRLAVHLAAAIATLLLLAYSGGGRLVARLDLAGELGLFAAFAVVLAMTWSINLHNFMDGINGLLALQAAFVAATIAALAWPTREVHVLGLGGAIAGASLAFLRFNFPRAKIFMGDVGSGALGYLVALLSFVAVLRGVITIWSALVLSSAFIVDATLTLLSRMARGRRWHAAHREHLYQWLVRSGWSHTKTTFAYLGWNLAVALPLATVVDDWRGAATAYVLAIAAWIAGKRFIRARVRAKMAAA